MLFDTTFVFLLPCLFTTWGCVSQLVLCFTELKLSPHHIPRAKVEKSEKYAKSIL